MPVRIEPHEEPIPGYRLIERLGSGGFGEVWKAEAPGGLFKAIKFVQCETGDDSACSFGNESDRSRADQELKSLSRVKSVHHPYVISLDRFEVVDDYLVIVMELADRTLADRFKQCRGQGLPGVPREELLGYLREAAEALDLMNSQYQLQHLDIKPQNLFLVHNHIKVADFGLVKDISDQKFMTITGGVTPVYAAPETFDGKFSRQSDQYSLAIVYQEMLTGHRPFNGTSMKQLILQHLQNSLDLTPVPVHDRPVLAKALAKNPEDRYASCLDFIEFLQRATMGRGSQPLPACPPAPQSDRSNPSMSKTEAARGGAGPIKPAEPNFSVGRAFLRDAPPGPPAQRSSLLRGAGAASDSLSKTAITPVRGVRKPTPPRLPQHEPAGIVQPALVIGIGQLGVDTLAQLRGRCVAELGSADAIPHVRLVAIDTDGGTLQRAANDPEPTRLRGQETVHARLQRPSHYLKTRDGKLPTQDWLNTKLLYRIPREQTSASVRALGRLAFVDNYRVIARRLEGELHACCSQDTAHETDPSCDLGLRSTKPRVYLITSLTGNTGSGMFLDVAYLVRRLLAEQGHADAEIVGMFYLPPVGKGTPRPALANTYASLVEMQHYCRPEATFSAFYETACNQGKGERVTASGPALERCVLLSLPAIQGRLNASDNAPLIAQAGELLYRELATPLGQTIDQARANLGVPADSSGDHQWPRIQSVGVHEVIWPRRALLREVSRRLCSQLVTRWLNKDAAAVADTIRQWTQERWEALSLRPEALIERFQGLAEEALQQKPEQLLAGILTPLQEQAAAAAKAKANPPSINVVAVIETMDRLERVLGLPEDGRVSKHGSGEPALLERTLGDISYALADDCEQKLAELAVQLLEDPSYRLAGAEEALRQFCTTVDQALQSQDTLARELAEKAAQLNQRIHLIMDRPVPSGTGSSTQWALNPARRPAANLSPADLFELVRTYTKTRYHSLVLGHLNRLYIGLRGHLSDQIREVGFCRQRLDELHGLFKPEAPKEKSAPKRADQRILFPPGCLDLKDAVAKLSATLSAEDAIAFDQRVQHWICNHCQALLQVCMGPSSLVRSLAPAMLAEAENFLSDRLQGTSVAEMYLARQRQDDSEDSAALLDDLQQCLDDAQPELGRIKPDNFLTVVALPNDEHGLELQELVRKQCRDARVLLADRQDEMLFYHELAHIPWKEVEQYGPIALECYKERCAVDPSSVHSREDVFAWQAIAESRR